MAFLFKELSATLRAFARNKRPQLRQVIAESQDGGPVLRETARAIINTAKWRPRENTTVRTLRASGRYLIPKFPLQLNLRSRM
ncbi:hypothetical protein DWB58_20135 [candidate division KSB1 bacterium]|nr:hypothetical protein [candidate division KSB1 bacterium]